VLRPLRRGPVTARRVAVSKLCELRGARAGPYRFSCVFTEWVQMDGLVRANITRSWIPVLEQANGTKSEEFRDQDATGRKIQYGGIRKRAA
jgi:hypothetical protein